MEESDNLYSDLTDRFMGTRYPGKYWQLHQVMPIYTLYGPSCLIAASRARQLAATLVGKFGERFWKEKDAGKFVFELLRSGGSVDLSSFSARLDATPLISIRQ